MKPAAIYGRVSTVRQAETGYGLPDQIARARRYAIEHDLTVPDDFEFADDVTGSSLTRSGLAQLRKLVASGSIGAVVVYSTDRLSRSLGDLIVLRDECKGNGVEIHYVRKGKLEDTAEAYLFDNIEGAFAQYEREKIVDRTVRGKVAKAQSGKPVSGGPPYGYRRIGEKAEAQLVIVESEAAIVREVYDAYLRGQNGSGPLGTVAIARILTERRVPTWADVRGKARRVYGPGTWHYSVILNMLQQKAYAGFLLYRSPTTDVIAEIPVPPIIPLPDWEAAQIKMRRNYEFSARHSTPGRYLLSGLVYCGCGCGLKWGGGLWHGILWYRSPRSRNVSESRCTQMNIHAEPLEFEAWAYFHEMIESDALESAIQEWVSMAGSVRDNQAKALDGYIAELARLESEAARLVEQVATGGVVGQALQAKTNLLNERHDSLVKERERLEAELAGVVPAQDRIRAALEFRDGLRTVITSPMSRKRMSEYLHVSGLHIVVVDNRATFSFKDNADLMMYPPKTVALPDLRKRHHGQPKA